MKHTHPIFREDEFWIPEDTGESITWIVWLFIALVVIAFILTGVLNYETERMNQIENSIKN